MLIGVYLFPQKFNCEKVTKHRKVYPSPLPVMRHPVSSGVDTMVPSADTKVIRNEEGHEDTEEQLTEVLGLNHILHPEQCYSRGLLHQASGFLDVT